MTPIRFPLRPRVVWIIGAAIEIQYIDCGDEMVARRAQDLNRPPQIISQVRQLSWSW